MEPKPSIARIVIYVPHPSRVEAIANATEVPAIISHVFEPKPEQEDLGIVNLHVFTNGAGVTFVQGVWYDKEKKPGTWHWPERK
jgi:hypothetical protein